MTPESPVLGAWERFAQLYGTPERIDTLWQQWMATQTETSIAFLEKAIADQAEANQLTFHEAKKRLVLEKLVEDRGPKFVERYLREHDQAGKSLKPLNLRKKKR
ncbi:hypothetical protein [Armatimonas rosea]|uniref:Uncharacterized protein n=1 Tax=Armatimonas rosea TaxID=685828 RepID=A0A7W9W5F4_ARMRO|nr:hypothetical protein [Armatimonas rosea]MBB6050389.1 hypothetical protein [Armatimonas rosea]